jgi:hypothetical protein
MKKLSLILMAAIGAVSASAASPQPQRYDVQVRIIEGGQLLASPRLIVEAGKLATFVSDDGKKGWSLKVIATPGEASGTVSLASDLEVWSLPESRRRTTTTVRVEQGRPAAFELSPQDPLPSMRVELEVDGA